MPTSLKRTASSAVRRLPLLLTIVAAVLFLTLGGTRYVTLAAVAENARGLHDAAEDWGAAAPLLFIAANAAMLMMLVIPAWFCTIIGGLLFGRWFGTAYALVGTTLGAAGVFLAARAGFSGLAERVGPRAAVVANGFRQNGLSYLVFLRLVPLFPFTLVNMAAALGRLPLRTYALGTLIGILPSVLIYASVGDLIMDLARQGRLPETNLWHQPRFLLPLLGLALLAIVPVFVGRWRRRR
jgi:uncharacterized membrane protein YdjX (TVP38/TMEM64 family)